MNDWKIFQGNSEPHDGINRLPPAPKWREFMGADEEIVNTITTKWEEFCKNSVKNRREEERGKSFRLRNDEGNDPNSVVNMVNAALYLRRPLLVTGKPGTGKTSLAYAVAYELNLGNVLPWYITGRSTLQDSLYRYDAIARLQDVQMGTKDKNIGSYIRGPLPSRLQDIQMKKEDKNIGSYIRLGPLGTALLPSRQPRVLLIDEVDKGDINLPNDLLNLFEEGEFEIPELSRIAKETPQVNVLTYDGIEVPVKDGKIRCLNFPFIILTNNGERDFPPAFLRRCLRLNMPYNSDAIELMEIVKAHLEKESVTKDLVKVERLINQFIEQREKGDLANDQLLNAVYIATNNFQLGLPTEDLVNNLAKMLMKSLTSEEDR